MDQQLHATHTSVSTTVFGSFMAQVYAWMTGGLFLTALVALLVNTPAIITIVVFNDWVIPVIFIIELIVVIALSALVGRIPTFIAALMFMFYSFLNGVVFGVIISAFTGASVFVAFAATGLTFLFMSVFGMVTKSDLTRWGRLAYVGLFGFIIASVLNLIFRSDSFTWILTYLGLAIFIVLVAYDTQRLKHMAAAAEQEHTLSRYAVLGALTLYLDFINLFIFILRITGRRR